MDDELPSFVLPEDYGPEHAERVQALPQAYVRGSDLNELTEEDIGKWFLCRRDDHMKVPDSLAIATKYLFESCLCDYLMIRKPTYDVLEVLKEINTAKEGEESGAGKSIALHGPRGSGKSISLGLISQWGYQNDWLVLGTRGEQFALDLKGFITASDTREGIYMQNRFAKEWFGELMRTQERQLKQIKLKRKYDYSWKSPKTGPEANGLATDAQGETLHDLAMMATIDTSTAASCVYDMVEELMLTDKNDCKVLVCMDNVNWWDQNSKFRDPKQPFVELPCRSLSMIDAFTRFMTQGPGNGLSTFAITCGGHVTLSRSNKHLAEAHYAIGSEIYSDDELVSAVTHFKVSNVITSDIDSFLLARIKAVTGNVPVDVWFDACLI